MIFTIITYNKASGERETQKVQADNAQDAREQVESNLIQVLSVSSRGVSVDTPNKPSEPAYGRGGYVATRTLRRRAEQALCDKAMGINRERDMHRPMYATSLVTGESYPIRTCNCEDYPCCGH